MGESGSFTYNIEEIEVSTGQLEKLMEDTKDLREFPTPFQITQGDLGDSVYNAGKSVKRIKFAMNGVALSYEKFLNIVKSEYENIENEMLSAMTFGE